MISQLQEKADEYNIPLCFAFIDYDKAFDSIEFNPLFESLENQGVEAAYINLLRDLYSGATSTHYQEGNTWMGGTHCTIPRKQMDKKCDRVDTTSMDKTAGKT